MTSAPQLEILTSRQFTSWLDEVDASLLFTTYQAGKLFLVGRAGDRLSVFERTFNRCMGLWATPRTLWMSSLYQLWRFENALEPGQTHADYDAVYVPRVGYTTGDLDVHDVAVDSDGCVVFVNTLFGCLCTVSETHSFIPVWKPPFLSALAPEDRCHLNGLALRDGQPAYVTSVSRSDVADGWRDRRVGGGVVVDIAAGDVVAEGLSMPHSPRWYRDTLWLLDAGTGWFGAVDPATGQFQRKTFLPGFLRGLAFIGDYAVVGTSKLRGDRAMAELPLTKALAVRDVDARCGLHVIDLRTMAIVHWMRLEGVVTELYDVAIVPGIARPMALGFKTDEIRRMLTVDA